MSSNSCGNCGNFQPQKGERFFNCTSAKQAGIGYGMQVRSDTQSCDAFVPRSAPSGTEHPLLTERAEPGNSQPFTKALLKVAFIAALIIAIVLLSWLLYACVAGSSAGPAPTHTPVPGTSATPTTTEPTPTPVPAYIVQYFDIGDSSPATTPDRIITVYSASRVSSYTLLTGKIITAPPGNVFIFISVNAVNRGYTTFSIAATDFSLTDSGGYHYTAQTESWPYYIGNPFGTILSPGQIDDGKILYIVPATASGLELSYSLDPASKPPVLARWKLPW